MGTVLHSPLRGRAASSDSCPAAPDLGLPLESRAVRLPSFSSRGPLGRAVRFSLCALGWVSVKKLFHLAELAKNAKAFSFSFY